MATLLASDCRGRTGRGSLSLSSRHAMIGLRLASGSAGLAVPRRAEVPSYSHESRRSSLRLKLFMALTATD